MKSAPIFFLKWFSCFCHCSSIQKHTKRTYWSCNNFFWQNMKSNRSASITLQAWIHTGNCHNLGEVLFYIDNALPSVCLHSFVMCTCSVAHLCKCLLWQQLIAFRYADMIKITCWSSNCAWEWGRKAITVTLNTASWIWKWVHCAQITSTVTRNQSDRLWDDLRDSKITTLQRVSDAIPEIWTNVVAEQCFQNPVIKTGLKAKGGLIR